MAQIYDPVCGMRVEAAGTLHTSYDGHRYFFCTDGCRAEFAADPERFVTTATDAGAVDGRTSFPPSPADVVYLRRCMACGDEAQAPISLDNLLGRRTMDEVESFVRGRWRKRLGRRAYRREHPRPLIRALLVYALQPVSPVRGQVVDLGLEQEVAGLRAAGLNRQQIRREFYHLSRAMREALHGCGLPPHLSSGMADVIDQRIAAFQQRGIALAEPVGPPPASVARSSR